MVDINDITIVFMGVIMVYKPTYLNDLWFMDVYGRYNELVFMGLVIVYKPTNNWGWASGLYGIQPPVPEMVIISGIHGGFDNLQWLIMVN